MPVDYIDELERDCEIALSEVIDEQFDDLPPNIAHLMAKAAVAVLEAVIEDE